MISPIFGILAALAATNAALAGGNIPPTVTVLTPNGGETLYSGAPVTVQWIATDNVEVLGVDVYVAFDGVNYVPILRNSYNAGSLTWFVQNRPTTQAKIRVVAFDFEYNLGSDESDAPFTIEPGVFGRLPTTLRDFDMPGTQPFGIDPLNEPLDCAVCHSNYEPIPHAEPYFNWSGSMMSFAGVDPLFRAAMVVANNDAPESGDLCIRCHMAPGWLAGRSNPTDGSQLNDSDRYNGVSCATCHSLVDPIYEAGVSPPEDQAILAGLDQVPTTFGMGQYVMETVNFRFRGPFFDAVAGHDFLPSPFHRDAALCGTCHDVSNVALDRAPNGQQSLNTVDTPSTNLTSQTAGVEQRTYSEWFFSAFNTPGGVYAPEFGGNRTNVTVCQDCHMRAITGKGCFFEIAPTRNDMPLHDLTGGSTWMLSLMPQVAPEDPNLNLDAIQAGILRARYMLQNAADLDLKRVGNQLTVRVTNRSGHKLPTGYPEGRRVWLNVRFYNAQNQLIAESGAYDPGTAVLTIDPQIKVYEAKLVINASVAAACGLPQGTPFHLVLNSEVEKDNRIPPLGFSNAAYQAFGGSPVGATYADGQNWDVTSYTIPSGAARADVKLYYQSTTKEYIDLLRDEGGSEGNYMYNLWNNNGKAPPETMQAGTAWLVVGDMNCDGVLNNFDIDPFVFALIDPTGYQAAYPYCDPMNGDANGDELFNNFDIDPFVQLLIGG